MMKTLFLIYALTTTAFGVLELVQVFIVNNTLNFLSSVAFLGSGFFLTLILGEMVFLIFGKKLKSENEELSD